MKETESSFLHSKRKEVYDEADSKIKITTLDELPYEVEIVAENLNVPWAMDISDTGTLYFTERIGKISSIDHQGNQQLLLTLPPPFLSRGEGGLMGIALDPDFTQNHTFYVMHTYQENDQIYNRVIRLVEQNNSATLDKVLLDRIPGGRIHNGGRVKIGPDQKLYIGTGDAGEANLAQDIDSLAGKILRINLDGSIPDDNPFRESPVYSYGHRNPQGLTWNINQIMYESEHGATAHDEINIIRPGVNYGWPLVQGNQTTGAARIQRPLIHSGINTWAPAGIAYITSGPWKGKLLVAALRGQQLLVITLNEEGTGIENTEPWLWNELGRLRDVIQGEDGSIYLATSNRDGRGNEREGDDKIIRLVP